MLRSLREKVRQAFGGQCGYCGLAETTIGAELTIDHYQPRAAGGKDRFDNLVYACHRCNLYKGDYWPTTEESNSGHYVLNPHHHDITRHIRENETTGELEPLTPTGAFHI
jgi:5-methylcytosine-specific restriction endonuclease McrA